MKKISILLAEDHPFTKQTLSYELKKQEEISFLGAVENGIAAYDFIKLQTPDVILMDIEMPKMDGIEATLKIKQFNPNIKVIILTSHGEKEKVFGAFSSGANGYCVKQIQMAELIQVIKTVVDGGIWFDKQIAGYIFEFLKTVDENKQLVQQKKLEDYNITPRERNVLKLIADGMSNSEIANELIISQNTVKNHTASIIKKLSLKDRAQVAIFVLKNNLLNN